ncbi:MAG: hypothetical protein LKF53_02800 [Solobacterium sp.]|jgi:hypothetical protein|nr:hypothetical protein [Solobacterium sp.]MCH4205308.1 hypothetical protein [Solobacterium sp.]MCH4226901.1 hypothetical protein [Solobacterium sp.]MCH4281661.1 hypothetical protein [Solobacterium sp.]
MNSLNVGSDYARANNITSGKGTMVATVAMTVQECEAVIDLLDFQNSKMQNTCDGNKHCESIWKYYKGLMNRNISLKAKIMRAEDSTVRVKGSENKWNTDAKHIPSDTHIVAELDDHTITSGRMLLMQDTMRLYFLGDNQCHPTCWHDPSSIVRWSLYPAKETSNG